MRLDLSTRSIVDVCAIVDGLKRALPSLPAPDHDCLHRPLEISLTPSEHDHPRTACALIWSWFALPPEFMNAVDDVFPRPGKLAPQTGAWWPHRPAI